MRNSGFDPDLERAWRARLPGGSPSCPDAARLVALVLGAVPTEERQALADHVVGCARCASETRILLAAHREAAPELGAAGPRMHWAAAAVAAGLLALAVGLARSRAPMAPPAPDALRGEAAEAARVSPPNASVLLAPPDELVWPADAATGPFVFRLADSEGRTLWASEPRPEPRVPLPGPLRARLETSGAYTWSVEARGSGFRSEPFWFRIDARRDRAR